MSSDPVLSLHQIGKQYRLYRRPMDRLIELLFRVSKSKAFWALRGIDLQIGRGEVLGIVGENGAGKSTLLQIICGTLDPSEGELQRRGKVAALLELGSGFNPEFTGRENVYLSGAISGLSRKEIDERFDEIVTFAGIGDFIDQPVKNYSSGMLVRLAFAVATSIDPDILVIDEALSVGDGAFARRSFDRIMALKERGCTIIFCSHALYQVEVLCHRVLWLDHGTMRKIGDPQRVLEEYQRYLDSLDTQSQDHPEKAICETSRKKSPHDRTARIEKIEVCELPSGLCGTQLDLLSEESTLKLRVDFVSDPHLPTPSVAVVITDDRGRNISSCSTYHDKLPLLRSPAGDASVEIEYPHFPLRKGDYRLHVLLMCEQAIHIYENRECARLRIRQKGSEVGIVSLPHRWHILSEEESTR